MHPSPRSAEASVPSTLAAARAAGTPARPLTVREVLAEPLPHLGHAPLTRVLLRLVTAATRPLLIGIRGAERIATGCDPFILALNHSQRPEAVVVPAWLALLRQGRLVRFIADWNFLLVPGLGLLMRRAGCLPLVRKDARPRALNAFKPLYRQPLAPYAHAKRLLASGESVGIFPEGTVNRDPSRLLPGRLGAARLSLESGRPIVPVGIRFPREPAGRQIRDRARLSLEIGAPLAPPPHPVGRRAQRRDVLARHRTLMHALAALSGKAWTPGAEVEGDRR
jgi:1-acyl-sn-glycerol-3-phosphate acyltransferase